MQSLKSAVADYQATMAQRKVRPDFTADWKEHLPAWSQWFPGAQGKPDCVLCAGLGLVRVDVTFGHPLFGKLFVCECCEGDADYASAQKLAKLSGLPAADRALTWDSMFRNQAAIKAITAVQGTIDRGWGWAYLYGDPGPGKTLVIKIAVAEMVKQGRPAVFVTWPDLLDHLRGGYRADDYDERIELWRNVEILAIDEFGRGRDNEFVEEVELKVLNHRYERATVQQRGITLFTSNFEPDHFDAWLASRLRDKRFTQLQMVGPDMRRIDL